MTKGGRRLSYEDDFWYKWKIRRFPLTFLFRELFPLPVTQKSIQCKSSKTKKNSWNNHISVIFFDKKNNGNFNTTKASEMKERLLKNDLLYQNELKSVQNYEWILMKKQLNRVPNFFVFRVWNTILLLSSLSIIQCIFAVAALVWVPWNPWNFGEPMDFKQNF